MDILDITMKDYELLEHTADLGIRVWGDTLKELFSNSAYAMYELIADIEYVKPVVSAEVKIKARDRDELLRNWLSELLSYFHTKDTLFCKFKIVELNEQAIVSAAEGEKVDLSKHTLKHDIKAVTFHSLKIEKKGGRLTTEIIFDI